MRKAIDVHSKGHKPEIQHVTDTLGNVTAGAQAQY